MSHLPCREILPNFTSSSFITALFSSHQQLSLPRFNPKSLSGIRPRTDTKKGAHSAHSHNYRQIRRKSSGNRWSVPPVPEQNTSTTKSFCFWTWHDTIMVTLLSFILFLTSKNRFLKKAMRACLSHCVGCRR